MMNLRSSILTAALMCMGAGAQTFTFPGVASLPVIQQLPDPFRMADGSRVSNLADWNQQRLYLKAMFQHYEYGFRPPVPGTVTVTEVSSVDSGYAIYKVLSFRVTSPSGSSFPFSAGMKIPKGTGPFAIVIKNDRGIGRIPASRDGVSRGYIMMDYTRTDLDLDANGSVGAAQTAYPAFDWATLQVWSWGNSVIIDWLEKQNYVDTSRIVITGQSRGGKTALLGGALDERIDLTVPSGSGAGGCGNYRFQQGGAETLENVTVGFPYWFSNNITQFRGTSGGVNNVFRLPFDQHMLKALVAPRALLCTDALGDTWANPWGTQQTQEAAQEVYRFLGVPEKIGVHFRTGGHEQNAEDIVALLDFADFIFKKIPLPTNYYAENFPTDSTQWTWRAPTPVRVRINNVGGSGFRMNMTGSELSVSLAKSGDFSVDVIGVDGKNIRSFTGKNSGVFVVNNLKPGVYVMNLRVGRKNVLKRKLIVD